MQPTPEPQLDLSNAPSVLYFYGLAGAGKSYVADLISKLSKLPVYHADDDLTPEMKTALDEKRPFTDEMRDRYFAIVAKRILGLKSRHKQLIVTQATYKQRHREYLKSMVPDMDLIWVTANESSIKERLRARKNGVGPDSAAALLRDFEIPSSGVKTIVNEEDDDYIIAQINRLYGKPDLRARVSPDGIN